jgi:hypothetical protein
MQVGWRMLALRNLHQFRAMTLRHRHTTRWNDLMAQFRMLPNSTIAWMAAHATQEDFSSRLGAHQYVHSRLGELRYAVIAGASYALANNLHLTILLPLDGHAFDVFTALHTASGGKFLKSGRLGSK